MKTRKFFHKSCTLTRENENIPQAKLVLCTHWLRLRFLLVYKSIVFPLSSLLAPVKQPWLILNIHHCRESRMFFVLNLAKHLFIIQDPHLVWIRLYFCYLTTTSKEFLWLNNLKNWLPAYAFICCAKRSQK